MWMMRTRGSRASLQQPFRHRVWDKSAKKRKEAQIETETWQYRDAVERLYKETSLY